MKKIKYIIACLLIAFTLNVFSQPNPPGNHGSGNNEAPGGGAPIGGGLLILLGLGAVYGGKKLYNLRVDNSKKL